MKGEHVILNAPTKSYKIQNNGEEQTLDQEPGIVNKRGETSIIQHLYKLRGSIFESLIRHAIIKGTLHANSFDTDLMIRRLINPVLSDNNKSIIHHLSSFHSTKLEKILTSFSFKKYAKSKQFK